MQQSVGQLALVVREYDEAIEFYVSVLGFTLVEDTVIPEQNKRWVVVAPPSVVFVREPKEEPYGTVAVFQDLYGNLWDLLQARH